ncbi:MAG: ATP-dependent DNA helicase RecG [Elusimicrobia bacterium]|nr:ATP-dependent DNA helicase RecG [Elusimicrobiota bacterium]
MLDQNIQFIKGVGPKRASLLKKMEIMTIKDLLGYFPREYEDRRNINSISSIVPGQKIIVKGKVETTEELKLTRNLLAFKIKINDGTGIAYGLFFRNVNPYYKIDIFSYLKKALVKDTVVYLSGVCEYNFGQKQIRVEDYEILKDKKDGANSVTQFERIVPVYPLTEGISQKLIRDLIKKCLKDYVEEWPDILPEYSDYRKMTGVKDALNQIHFPEDFKRAETARQRLAFDEFFLLETALSLARKKDEKIIKNRAYELKKNLLTPFREKLKFEFTQSQKKVINEIFDDLRKPQPMHRLLMGDVGSGKTVVALSAMLYAIENGYQTVLIAPTEILAEQHFLTISDILKDLSIKITLLTGKVSGKIKEKRKILQDIFSGSAQIIIGTHAILEKSVNFKNLALIVIDEQHKFGVIQRASLQQKSSSPDVLIMTATPIPRTLALTIYGDMDISKIEHLPPGRQPIETLHLNPEAAYEIVKQEIKKGNQAYIVYPLIEESDKIELKAAVKEAENLSKTIFNGFKVGLLHGQISSKEREQTMLEFRAHKFDILIATTIIEVGIDIPNATVMVIEHADRFGLATLHQLRGRIGRGSQKSTCIIVGEVVTEQSKKRIKVMLESSDGFKIAEEDLLIRGPGEFFGTIQSGMPNFKAGNIITDLKLIEDSKNLAANVIMSDPELSREDHKKLKNEVVQSYGKHFNLFRVG